MEDTCALFADKFVFFEKNRLWECRLTEHSHGEEISEIVSLLQKMEWLHMHFNEATAKNAGFERANLPCISIASKSEDSSECKLVIEVVPCDRSGFTEIRQALEKMERMVNLIALLNKSRGKFKSIHEVLKFLYSHIQRQMFPEKKETEPLLYDAGEALKLLESIKFRPGQALIKKHADRVRQKFGSGSKGSGSKLGWHSAISRDVMSVQSFLRNELTREITEKDHPSAVQTAIKAKIEGKTMDD